MLPLPLPLPLALSVLLLPRMPLASNELDSSELPSSAKEELYELLLPLLLPREPPALVGSVPISGLSAPNAR